MDSNEFDDCILQGDLNWDMGRNSGFSSAMGQFTERVGLLSAWDHYPVNYTHMHTDLVSTSTLDHFRKLRLLVQGDHAGTRLNKIK